MGFTSRSVEFGGTNEYVSMGDVLGFEYTDAFSFSFWFRTTSGSSGYCVSKMAGDSTYRGYGIYIGSTGKLRFILSNSYLTNAIDLESPGAYNDGLWHHAVVTKGTGYTASACAAYVDNTPVTMTVIEDDLSATTLNAISFNLGGRTDGSVVYVGHLDEVAVYDKELSPAEVAWIWNSTGIPRDLLDAGAPSNLVAWWRMGEGDTYPTLLDSAGVGPYPGTMQNMESSDITYNTIMGLPGAVYAPTLLFASGASGLHMPGDYYGLGGGTPGPSVTTYYKMRARDSGATPPGYVTWIVSGSPDFLGSNYAGGTPTPVGPMIVGSAIVAASWEG